MDNSNANIQPEQLDLIESNLKLSIDERIDQLQSAVSFIEEMKSSELQQFAAGVRKSSRRVRHLKNPFIINTSKTTRQDVSNLH